jgi:CubicO group peptidase (beta-lactamase class C family)
MVSRRFILTGAAASVLTPALVRAEARRPALTLDDTLAELALRDGGTLRYSLKEVMAASGIPAISLAVISRYALADTLAFGTTAVGETSSVRPDTLFQAASISKPVAATAALALVHQGRLDLDGNVNDRLKSWRVPDNAFTAREKVTLRRLISHTAGLSVHGFPGYAAGVPLPTIPQILDGLAPANTEPVRVMFEPGSRQEYSGGGITIEQLLMTDVTGRAFADLMHDTVLAPTGMTNSTFVQPLPNALASRAAAGTGFDGTMIPGRWHTYPEMAAAGLWTTPTDLARFAIATARSRLGKSNPILPIAMMDEMFRKVPNGEFLGFFGDPRNPGVFQHNGGNAGYRSLLMMNADTGDGIVTMTNADGGWGLMELTVRRIATQRGWTHDFGGPVRAVWLVAITKGADMALSHYEAVRASAEESDLNLAGQILLATGRTDEAIRLYSRNVEDYPQSGNVYDSLAWAYEVAGDKSQAIANYRLSLARNPGNGNARDRLKALDAPLP